MRKGFNMARPANGDKKVISIIHTGVMGEGGSNSVPVQNCYHFARSLTTASINRANVFTAWKAAIGDKVILGLNERYTSQSVDIRCINDAEERASTHAFTDPGAIAGDCLPARNAVAMLLRSDTRGPWAKGSKHFGPISESDIGEDVLNAGALVVWNVVRAAILAGFTDSDGNLWKPTVVSPTYSQLAVNPTEVLHYPVIEVLLNKTVGTLRSRKVRTVR